MKSTARAWVAGLAAMHRQACHEGKRDIECSECSGFGSLVIEVDRLQAEVKALTAQVVAVERVADEGPFLTRWIDGTVLVERADIRAALRGESA